MITVIVTVDDMSNHTIVTKQRRVIAADPAFDAHEIQVAGHLLVHEAAALFGDPDHVPPTGPDSLPAHDDTRTVRARELWELVTFIESRQREGRVWTLDDILTMCRERAELIESSG